MRWGINSGSDTVKEKERKKDEIRKWDEKIRDSSLFGTVREGSLNSNLAMHQIMVSIEPPHASASVSASDNKVKSLLYPLRFFTLSLSLSLSLQ